MKKTSQTQTINDLRSQVRDLKKEIDLLSQDSSYGVVTRPAILLELRRIKKTPKYLIFLDIDRLHELNSTLPGKHEEANRKIRRALKVRSSDVLIRARWYSGDELIFLITGDPVLFVARLNQNFAREGMSFTSAFTPFSGDLEGDAARAKKIVDELKAARGITR